MFPCCNYCDFIYLNKDGSINFELYQKMLENLQKQKRKLPDPTHLCKCNCHKIGNSIIH